MQLQIRTADDSRSGRPCRRARCWKKLQSFIATLGSSRADRGESTTCGAGTTIPLLMFPQRRAEVFEHQLDTG